jgi:hypothetical protein
MHALTALCRALQLMILFSEYFFVNLHFFTKRVCVQKAYTTRKTPEMRVVSSVFENFNAGNIYPEYIWRWALSEYERTRSGSRGGAQPALNGNKVRELLIPLPPLEEQKCIVEKIEQLMGLCDELELKLRNVREDSEKLMEMVVRGLLEGAAA